MSYRCTFSPSDFGDADGRLQNFYCYHPLCATVHDSGISVGSCPAPTVVHVTLEMCASRFKVLEEAGEAMAAKKLFRVPTKLVPLLDSIQSTCLGYHVMLMSFLGRTGMCKGGS